MTHCKRPHGRPDCGSSKLPNSLIAKRNDDTMPKAHPAQTSEALRMRTCFLSYTFNFQHWIIIFLFSCPFFFHLLLDGRCTGVYRGREGVGGDAKKDRRQGRLEKAREVDEAEGKVTMVWTAVMGMLI